VYVLRVYILRECTRVKWKLTLKFEQFVFDTFESVEMTAGVDDMIFQPLCEVY
jgi:hypothetical protein